MDLKERISLTQKLNYSLHQDLFWMLSRASLSKKLIPEFHYNPWPKGRMRELYEFLQSTIKQKTENQNELILGKYAEQILLYALTIHPDIQVLSNNIQIVQDGITTGEIDFLIQEKENFIHLEFALKYYIKIKNGNYLIGPNSKDNWQAKKTKLLEKQSKLANQNKSQLGKEFSEIQWQEKVLVLGDLFEYIESIDDLPQKWALKQNQIDNLREHANYFSVMESKLNWIFPFRVENIVYPISKLGIYLKESKQARLVVLYNQKKIPSSWGFILPNKWPSEFN